MYFSPFAAVLGAVLAWAPGPAFAGRTLLRAGIDETIPAGGNLPRNRSFLAVARRQLLATVHGARLYAEIAAGAAVKVRQDSVVSARGAEKRVIGVTSTPAVEDAIVCGDEVLLKDFVIMFDEDRFLTAERNAARQRSGSWLPGALYAHELGHIRALLAIGRAAFNYDGRLLQLNGDAATRRRNLRRVLSQACEEERKVREELVPGQPHPPCSHARELQQLAAASS